MPRSGPPVSPCAPWVLLPRAAAPGRGVVKGLASTRRGWVTATGTIALALVFALVVAFARWPVRDSAGVVRTERVLDVWRALLDHLPPEAPFVLTRAPLTIALVAALLALAYAIVATLQLRDS